MKLTKHLDKASLLKAVPKQYKTLVHLVPVDASPYMLAVLKDSVAHIRVIEKTLSHLEEGFSLVVAVENMTEEAAEELKTANGFPLTIRDYYWTEDRHKSIQQFGGVKEKPRERNS